MSGVVDTWESRINWAAHNAPDTLPAVEAALAAERGDQFRAVQAIGSEDLRAALSALSAIFARRMDHGVLPSEQSAQTAAMLLAMLHDARTLDSKQA